MRVTGRVRSRPATRSMISSHVCLSSLLSPVFSPLESELRIQPNMSRKALIAANWKMYKTPAEAKAFVDALLPLVAGHDRDQIALFPSPVLLPTVIGAVDGSNVAVGAQNIHF